MWFVIILIIVVAVIIISVAAANSDSKKEAEWDREREYETQKQTYRPVQVSSTSQTYSQKINELTESEKQQLSRNAKPNVLNAAINAYNLALNGDSEAMAYLGEGIYHTYLNNPTKAIYWLQKSESLGNLDAKYFIGRYHQIGFGYPMDKYNKALGVGKIMEATRGGNELAIDCLRRESNMSDEELRAMGIPV